MLSEVLFFSFCFDAPKDLISASWWAPIVLQVRFIVRLMFVIPVAIAAFGGTRLLVRIRQAFEGDASENLRWPTWLLAHGIALMSFAQLTVTVCDRDVANSAHPGWWVFAWVVAGLITASTGLMTILRPAAWLTLARQNLAAIAMSLTVAVTAFFLSNSTTQLWQSMAGTTLFLVRMVLVLLGQDVVCDPARYLVGVVNFKVMIAPECSGFEGIGLVLAFLATYLGWFRASLRWPQAYLLLLLGASVIWLLNVLRIVSLILIGAWASPEVAVNGFHSQAGWIAFLGVSLGLVTASRRLPFFSADLQDDEGATTSNPSASFLGPFLAIVATSMVTSAFSSGFDTLYWVRVFTGGFALWYFRRDFSGLLRGWSWQGLAIGVISFAIWVALEPASTPGASSLSSVVGAWPREQAWTWIALRVIGSVAIVPLAEELAFRGYLTRRLIAADFESVEVGRFSWPSLLISSACFGLLHGRWLAGMIVGILFGLAMYRRGKLGDAILAHAVANLLIAATVLATGDWTMWS